MPILIDVADALAGMTAPRAGTHPLGELRHRVQHLVHVRHDVMAIDQDARIARRAQRHVQHRALLGDVDLVAAEHRIATLRHAALLRELQQQPHGLVGDAVLRIVEVQSGALCRQAFATARIIGEELPQVHVLDLLVMRGKCLPRRRLVWPPRICHCVLRSFCSIGSTGCHAFFST